MIVIYNMKYQYYLITYARRERWICICYNVLSNTCVFLTTTHKTFGSLNSWKRNISGSFLFLLKQVFFSQCSDITSFQCGVLSCIHFVLICMRNICLIQLFCNYGIYYVFMSSVHTTNSVKEI